MTENKITTEKVETPQGSAPASASERRVQARARRLLREATGRGWVQGTLQQRALAQAIATVEARLAVLRAAPGPKTDQETLRLLAQKLKWMESLYPRRVKQTGFIRV